MVMAKKKSKRLTCAKKYKIQKKVREHHRKVRKEEKKKSKSKARKDPGIPNSFPFKEQLLKQLEERKQRAEEEKERQKDKRFKEVNKRRKLELLQKDAQKRAKEFERKQDQMGKQAEKVLSKGAETSLRAYYKEFKKVVDAADVLIEVLDARDPIGCRCPQMEETIMSSGGNKRLVLLLNKIDLVPKDVAEKWLKYFRNELPTLAFKASTQSQKQKLGQSKVSVAMASKDMLSSTGCVGASTLLKLLGNYCRNKDIKTSITVGIVGFPNVGKSSVINSLKRSKACGVGSMPGFTKNMQEITLDKHIKLLDCPGVVMGSGSTDTQIILRNCVKVDQLEDVVVPVEAILRRCNKHQIMEKYCVPDYQDAQEFLAFLGKRLGKLKKGGVPDINAAAKSILQDWNSGKITFHTIPPERKIDENHESVSVVQYWGAEFDLKAIEKEEKDDMKDLISAMSGSLVLNPGKPVTMEDDGESLNSDQQSMDSASSDEEDDDEDDEDDEDEKIDEDDEEPEKQDVVIKMDKKSKKKKPEVKDTEMMEANADNKQVNKASKKAYKQKRKLQRKQAAKREDAMDDSENEDYDFQADYV